MTSSVWGCVTHAGRERVDVILPERHVRKISRDAGDDLVPQDHRVLKRIRFRGARQELSRARPREGEGVPGDPFDASSCEDPGLFGELVRGPRVQAGPGTTVLALGVFTDADHVDVRSRPAAERRGHARQQPHRPQIDELPEALTEGKDQLASGNVIGDAWISDRAEIDGVERAQLIEGVRIRHAPVAEVEITSPWELGELAAEAAPRRHDLHDVDAGGSDFLSDAVSGNHCYAISCHLC